MEEVLETVFSAIDDADIDRERIAFIYLFGSSIADPEAASDVDVCISLDAETPAEFGYKIQGRLPDEYDLSIYQNLPLHVKKDVFKGELLYTRDDSVYDEALQVFRDFETFEPLYKTAIGADP